MVKLTEKSIPDIIDKRQRLSEPDRAASWRMSSLLQTFNYPLKHRDELLRYFPIAVVATIDGYFRARLGELIDSGEPFLSNAVSAFPSVTLDTPLAVAIAAKGVSLGELLMHSVSISSFESLIQIVAKTTGVPNFLERIAEIKPTHLDAKESDRIIRDPIATWAHLGRVFSLRHILCHELAEDLEVDEEEIRGLLITSQQFMAASAEWLQKLQHPNPPPTRAERLGRAKQTLFEAKQQLQKQLSLFEQANNLSDGLRLAVSDVGHRLNEYHHSLEGVMIASNPMPDFPLFDEEQAILDHAEATKKLSTHLEWAAIQMGIDRHLRLEEQ